MRETHEYFTVEGTACTIPKRGALAIYCGNAPRKNEDGSTSHSLRGPLLIMPPEMFTDGEEIMQQITGLLEANAAMFFESAKDKQAEHDRRVLAGEI